jgi:hypothetical protein
MTAQRLSSLEVRPRLDGGYVIGVIAKRTYDIRQGRCILAQNQIPLVEEPAMKENGLLEHDSDRLLQRRFVDVVIDGCARSQAPRSTFDVNIGPLSVAIQRRFVGLSAAELANDRRSREMTFRPAELR